MKMFLSDISYAYEDWVGNTVQDRLEEEEDTGGWETNSQLLCKAKM